jgi:hypothetical protein
MATLPTQLGSPPYIGWQYTFCKCLYILEFLAIIFVYEFFYKFFYKFFYYKSSHTPGSGKALMKTVIHIFMYSLIHELNSSRRYF